MTVAKIALPLRRRENCDPLSLYPIQGMSVLKYGGGVPSPHWPPQLACLYLLICDITYKRLISPCISHALLHEINFLFCRLVWSHWNRFGITPAKKSIQVIVCFFVTFCDFFPQNDLLYVIWLVLAKSRHCSF